MSCPTGSTASVTTASSPTPTGPTTVKTAIVTGHSIKDKTRSHAQLSQCPAHHAGLRSRSRSGRGASTRLLSALDCPGGAAVGGLDFDDFEERSAQSRALFLLQPDGKR